MEPDEENVASQLKGNTLRVYWHLLRSSRNTVGARETRRELGFSSPALAVYHLEKLRDLGLVEKERGEYRLVKEGDVGVLRQFIRLGTLVLPRYLLYAGLFTTLLIFYTTQVRIVNANATIDGHSTPLSITTEWVMVKVRFKIQESPVTAVTIDINVQEEPILSAGILMPVSIANVTVEYSE